MTIGVLPWVVSAVLALGSSERDDRRTVGRAAVTSSETVALQYSNETLTARALSTLRARTLSFIRTFIVANLPAAARIYIWVQLKAVELRLQVFIQFCSIEAQCACQDLARIR